MRRVWCLWLGLTLLGFSSAVTAQSARRSFTIADEIGLTLFNDPDGGPPEIRFSPNGRYFAIWSERGVLESNSVEDSLRFYSTDEVRKFVERSANAQPPAPGWIATRTSRQGRIIDGWRWLADSSGVAFLEHAPDRSQSLWFADMRSRTIQPLLPGSYDVRGFDIRDREHFVYLAAGPDDTTLALQEQEAHHRAAAVAVTGTDLFPILFPEDPRWRPRGEGHLWAIVDGKRVEVWHDGIPFVASDLWDWSLALSPDSQSVAAIMRVKHIPQSWQQLYPPPYQSAPGDNIRSGGGVFEFVRIDLKNGSVQPLTDAPLADSAGWDGGGGPSWSSDGQAVVLPATFIKSQEGGPSQPCVAVVDAASSAAACVEKLMNRASLGESAKDAHSVSGAQFVRGDRNLIEIDFYDQNEILGKTYYRRTTSGDWQLTKPTKDLQSAGPDGLEVTVKQSLDHPPVLMATLRQSSSVLGDPNPQLKNFEFGEASVYEWRDKEGREWRGGLYKPVGYVRGRKYPLVIQNHGFSESNFLPSGVFSTAFAARAFAAQGIVVLQVGGSSGCSSTADTPQEGTCEISGYVSAANQLISEGLVDPERIGIIGFSRTCYYVMEALTTNALPFKAALIADGGMLTYSQYIMGYARGEFESMIGARPFGEGLEQWLKRSPGFNLDKITTPLMIHAPNPVNVLFMWEPYAGLRALHKPVDMIMLNTDQHVLTNPDMRIASQGGSVDWFRFWLQDYEDPDPLKAEQYRRWKELKKLLAKNEKNSAVDSAATN